MRYVLALALLGACGADAHYRGTDGAIVGGPWRCKDGTYTGSWLGRHGSLQACPPITPIACPDPAGGVRLYLVTWASVLARVDGPPMPAGPNADAILCERIRRADD